ncbi:hypothetical protein [Bosea vestrisii]
MTRSIRELVKLVRQVVDGLPVNNACGPSLSAALSGAIPDAPPDDLRRELAEVAIKMKAEAEENASRQAQMESADHLFDGMPDDMSFEEAVRIKAEAGDLTATAWLRALNSPDHVGRMALLDAAVEAPPGWRREGLRYVRREGSDGPVYDVSLVDWFKRTYPREAAEVERAAAAAQA